MKTIRVLSTGAVALSALLLPAHSLSAAGAVPGCGAGLELTNNPSLEAFLASTTGGNVNGDGYVCLKRLNEEAKFFGIVVDNRVGGA